MKKNQITKEKIISLIKEEAEVIKRKTELYEQVQVIEEELKVLSERGLTGTVGFIGDGSNPSGFEQPQDISYVAQLQKDMGMSDEEIASDEAEIAGVETGEIAELKAQNDELKGQLEQIQSMISNLLDIEKAEHSEEGVVEEPSEEVSSEEEVESEEMIAESKKNKK